MIVAVSFCAAAAGAASCDTGASKTAYVEEAIVAAGMASQPPNYHRLGAIRASDDTMRAHAVAAVTPLLAQALPASVDLSGELGPVGNQMSEGSCVGWAVAYSAKTMLDVAQNHWVPDDITHEFSPSWIYNQINGGQDKGSNITDALNLVVSSGVDTISSFPYIDHDFLTQPSAISKARAAHFKAASWGSVTVSSTNFKNLLAAGKPVIVVFNVLPDFDNLNGTTNTIYDTNAGTRNGWTQPCDATCTDACNGPGLCGTCNPTTNVCTIPSCSSDCVRGSHAVVLVGYDDTQSAFKLINQWGTAFGANGFGWIGYSFLTDSELALQAFTLTNAADVPGVQDSPILFAESQIW